MMSTKVVAVNQKACLPVMLHINSRESWQLELKILLSRSWDLYKNCGMHHNDLSQSGLERLDLVGKHFVGDLCPRTTLKFLKISFAWMVFWISIYYWLLSTLSQKQISNQIRNICTHKLRQRNHFTHLCKKTKLVSPWSPPPKMFLWKLPSGENLSKILMLPYKTTKLYHLMYKSENHEAEGQDFTFQCNSSKTKSLCQSHGLQMQNFTVVGFECSDESLSQSVSVGDRSMLK